MKFSPIFALLAGVQAHTIFQKISVNGADQGQLKGIRAPGTNNPTYSVSDSNFACNSQQYKDNNVITVPQGAKVGAWFGHVIGGPQGSNDVENPIAQSHHGPIQVYLAKVDNAASASSSGQKWFKVGQEGLNNGKWAVDNMYAAGGWWYFTMPTCVTAGNYLMRVELLALHSAGTSMGAQFYMGCAQISVTGSGSSNPSTVSFPGTYAQNDPGILISIYDNKGQPYMGGKSYPIPGPSPLSCSGENNGGGSGGSPTTTLATTTRTATTTLTASPTSSAGSGAPLYGQCGGQGWTGPTTCQSGTCKSSSQYYSQCLP